MLEVKMVSKQINGDRKVINFQILETIRLDVLDESVRFFLEHSENVMKTAFLTFIRSQGYNLPINHQFRR